MVATFSNNLVEFTGAIFFVVENLMTLIIKHQSLYVPCTVEGSALSFADGLQKYYKFKFKYFIASYT